MPIKLKYNQVINKFQEIHKNKYCDKNNIKLIRISYIDFKEIKNTLSCLLK
jgi:hypothetical protein